MTLELSKGNTTASYGIDFVSNGISVNTGSVQDLALSHIMYKIGMFEQLTKNCEIFTFRVVQQNQYGGKFTTGGEMIFQPSVSSNKCA